MRRRTKATLTFFILMSGTIVAGLATARNYPAKPIRLIVPYPVGGAIDVVARTLAPKFIETFKQPIVVDNRTGAAGAIGTETAVRANPDGYTMLMVPGSYAANAALQKLPYDPVYDVTPIALIGVDGFVVTLHPSVPAVNIRELIAYDKASPGKLAYGSGGTGSAPHLATELFNQMAGTRITHVPYKGIVLALNDLIGGQIQLALANLPTVIPQIKANRVRGIAVTATKRSNALPDIPTVGEAVAGYEAATWAAMFGPKALPKDIVARWNHEINRSLQLPDVKARLASDGMEPAGGTPERLHETLTRDVAKWQRVVKIASIKPEG